MTGNLGVASSVILKPLVQRIVSHRKASYFHRFDPTRIIEVRCCDIPPTRRQLGGLGVFRGVIRGFPPQPFGAFGFVGVVSHLSIAAAWRIRGGSPMSALGHKWKFITLPRDRPLSSVKRTLDGWMAGKKNPARGRVFGFLVAGARLRKSGIYTQSHFR